MNAFRLEVRILHMLLLLSILATKSQPFTIGLRTLTQNLPAAQNVKFAGQVGFSLDYTQIPC